MITPRKEETGALVEIIDSGAFDTPEQMAGALFKRAAQLIQERDGKTGTGLYLTVLEGAPFGPFYTAADAERFAKTAEAELGLEGRTVRLWAPTTYDLGEKHQHRTEACVCGHVRERHVEKKRRQGVQHAECGVWDRKTRAWCPCKTFNKEIS